MQKIKGKPKMLLYGCAGLGVNLLNLFMTSYLCSALLIGGFAEEVLPFQTYVSHDLIIASVWAVFAFAAKIIDGVIDIPMASLTDRLKSRWGRRRPSLVIGLVPLVLSFLAFLFIPNPDGATILNTVYYGLVLFVFYTAYTLVMVTYYATFTEIVDTEQERGYISNVKSVCDIIYFILGYVVVRMLLNGLNIRLVALICLPLVLTMLIPLFMIKEPSSKEGGFIEEKTVNLFKSLGYTFKNKDFIIWMIVYSFMTFGIQLFLGGINEYFSKVGMNMIFVMLAAFAPVPFTLMLFNYLIKKKGFKFAFQYVLLVFALSMFWMFGFSFMEGGTLKTVMSIIGGLFCSFAVGAMFAVAYSIPSQLAAEDEKRTGISHSAMYFAVQGLFAGVATGIGTGIVLTALKGTEEAPTDAIIYMTLICAIACLISFALTFILPRSLSELGREQPTTTEEKRD